MHGTAHLDHVEGNNSKPKQTMSKITVRYENTPTTEERTAIVLLKTGADLGELTRQQAAQILRNAVNSAYVHIGGGHIALCRGWDRVALVTSNHPDWN